MQDPAAPLHVTIEPGTKLDRYELLCLLAHGGMANVWLARMAGKHGFEKLLAIKTILAHEADNESFKEMFLDEARLASRIDHPSVVRVTDVGEFSGVTYLVMELIEGEALDKLVRTADKAGVKVPVGIALRIIADACQGLQAAHELKDGSGLPLHVVHRDMSPQNILVTTSGLAKIIDFGIAKARDRSAGPTTTGTLKGKISYMPMEQAHGKEVDARADTWALGAVLYYLLAGRPPYKEDTQLATLRKAMNGAPIEPLPATVPALVRSFVNKALMQDITRRFQTAAEMSEALDALIRRLGNATTHAEAGAFVKSVMRDKLEARKRLVNKALFEATNRERSGVELTIPIVLENGNEPTAIESGAYAALGTGTGSETGQRPRPEDSGISNVEPRSIGTVGTFGRPSYLPARVPLWQSIALAAVALMGAVGIVLMVIVLLGRGSPPVKAAAVSAPPTIASAPAALPSAEPAASETPAVTAPSSSGAVDKKIAAAAPSSATRPPLVAPVQQGVQPQAKGPASPAPKLVQPKKRDDEPGF